MEPDLLGGFRNLRPTAQVLAGLSVVLAVWIVIVLLGWAVGRLDCWSCTEAKDRAKASSDARTALLQLLLGVGGAGTLYFTWRNYTRTVEDSKRAAADSRETQKLARESRTSENFIKAVEQLGNQAAHVRVGGIYGLGRLLRTASVDDDYWPLMDVLTAFVRENASRSYSAGRGFGLADISQGFELG